MATQDKSQSNTFRYDPHFLESYQTPCNSDSSLSRMHFNVSPEDLRVIEEVMPKERPTRKST